MKRALLAGMAVVLLTGCVSLPSGKRSTCIYNLRVLDSATRQCAMILELKNGERVPRNEMSAYIRHGIDSLRCPAGGVYASGIVGTDPSCSVHGTLTEATTPRKRIKQDSEQ